MLDWSDPGLIMIIHHIPINNLVFYLNRWGSKIHIEEAFRYYGKYLENYGMAHTLGEGGQLFEFVGQKPLNQNFLDWI